MEKKKQNSQYSLPIKEQLKMCYDVMLMNAENIHDLSNKLNIYLAYGCSFLLIYFFNNITTLKMLIPYDKLFFLISLTILNIIFSLLQLFVSLKGEIRSLKFMAAKHVYLQKKDEESLQEYQEYKNSNFLSFLSAMLEVLSFLTTLLITFGIINVFYNLIYINN